MSVLRRRDSRRGCQMQVLRINAYAGGRARRFGRNPSEQARVSVALIGSATLILGVFLPIVRAPIIGGVNYFSNGRGDGALILVLAVLSAALALKRRFQWLWATTLPSLVLLLGTFVMIRQRIAEMSSSLESDLAGNPFKGLAQVFTDSVQLEYGWAVLVLG